MPPERVSHTLRPLEAAQFERRFRWHILIAWTVPAVFGLSFLVFVRMFSLAQLGAILTSPVEPLFVLSWIGFAVWYFHHFAAPIRGLLESNSQGPLDYSPALERMQRFPLHFWALFLFYLLMAPSSVIVSLHLYTDFTANPEDWLRIHLVALIVSIIVGLPIFFRVLDLFGQVVIEAPLDRPHVTLKTKVFLIGALTPLLVDTMIVQYYWSRTGYFGVDTFLVWITLELLAIGGSLMFVASFGQSLSPLQSIVSAPSGLTGIDGSRLAPHSTDELGVLANRYRRLLKEGSIRNELLHVSNRVFREKGDQTRIGDVVPQILDLCQRAVGGDLIMMFLADPEGRNMLGVAQTGRPFDPNGYCQLPLNEPSVAGLVYERETPIVIDDVQTTPYTDYKLCEQLEVRSIIGAPLDAEGKVIGSLLSLSRADHEFNSDALALFQGFAREAALAVHTQLLHAKQAEMTAELRRVSEYNRLLLESTGEGIFGVDMAMRCTFVNQAATDMLGYGSEEMLGQDILALLQHSDEHQNLISGKDCHIFRTLEEDGSFHVDTNFMRTKKGEMIPVQFSSNPIHAAGRITGAVVVFRNIAKAREMARKMDYLASHDALTGLLNRYRFEQQLAAALNTAREEDVHHALCYLDLDQFKVVNDTCGHVAGDELLRQITAQLQKHVRQGDTLARLGGDEFGVLLERCPLDQALRLAHVFRKTVEAFRFVWQGKSFALGVSIGIAPIRADSTGETQVLSNADTACYMAKDAGRNRVHVHHTGDAELSRRFGEMQWVSRIQDALDKERFFLAIQIIKALKANHDEGIHLEVLIRMRDGRGSDVPPGAFLPAAERFNLSSAIDRWVVGHTFDWVASLGDRLDDLDLCCINLSGNTIGDDDFLNFVLKRLRLNQFPGTKICFEITETAAIANLVGAVHFITELKRFGCLFALDDFGSGMSSFGYLKSLPVDFLKIDGSFVRDMVDDPIDHTMVKSINDVGHAMGIRTVAEFVENEATHLLLRRLGVDYAQGYGIHRPSPLDEIWTRKPGALGRIAGTVSLTP